MKILFINFNMHQLYLNENIPVGGATVQTSNWIKGFKEIGCKVGVLGFKNTNKQVFEENEIEFVASYEKEKGMRILRNFYYRIPQIYKAISSFDPDIIYSDVPSWQTIMFSTISKLQKRLFIQRISNDNMVDKRIISQNGKLKYLVFRMGLKSSEVILCQNDYQFDILKKRYPGKVIHKFHNPFLADNNIEILKSRNYVAWIGIFQHQKNMDALLRIALTLSSIEFRIAGDAEDGIDAETMNTIRELKKLNNVIFVGYIENRKIPHFLSGAYCLLNTSYYEGFSNTYLESFSVGTPVVTTKSTDPDQIIEKNHLGFISDTYEELPACIMKIIENDPNESYGIARQYLVKYHNPKTLAMNLLGELGYSDIVTTEH